MIEKLTQSYVGHYEVSILPLVYGSNYIECCSITSIISPLLLNCLHLILRLTLHFDNRVNDPLVYHIRV
jgi:hypothetical protein